MEERKKKKKKKNQLHILMRHMIETWADHAVVTYNKASAVQKTCVSKELLLILIRHKCGAWSAWKIQGEFQYHLHCYKRVLQTVFLLTSACVDKEIDKMPHTNVSHMFL